MKNTRIGQGTLACPTAKQVRALCPYRPTTLLSLLFPGSQKKLELNSLRNRGSVVSAADAENGTPARCWMAARGLRGEEVVGGKGRFACCAHLVGS